MKERILINLSSLVNKIEAINNGEHVGAKVGVLVANTESYSGQSS
jgi:hypothetical protein